MFLNKKGVLKGVFLQIILKNIKTMMIKATYVKKLMDLILGFGFNFWDSNRNGGNRRDNNGSQPIQPAINSSLILGFGFKFWDPIDSDLGLGSKNKQVSFGPKVFKLISDLDPLLWTNIRPRPALDPTYYTTQNVY